MHDSPGTSPAPRTAGLWAGHHLLALLRDPAMAPRLSAATWEQVIACAREFNLLGRIHSVLQQAGALEQVPTAPRLHLESAWCAAETQRRAVHREIAYLMPLLQQVTSRVVVLKGAAYSLAGLPPAYGRQFSDIDILVPKGDLDRVEAKLNWAGWLGTHHGAYDQRYYRQWMHEIPPLRHPHRGSTLDVHHTILPETARYNPDPRLLLDAAQPLPAHDTLAVLAPTDMVIHSATHLFLEGEIPNGLRDLLDLDALLRHFGTGQGFWDALPERARQLDLSLPVFLALRYCSQLLATPVPGSTTAAMESSGPGHLGRRILDSCYSRLLVPSLPQDPGGPGRGLASMTIFLRGHRIRMPLPILARHILQKAVVVPLLGQREPTPQPWARH